MKLSVALAAVFVAAVGALAQDQPATMPVYKLDFTFRDNDNGAKARHFSLIVQSNGKGTLRLGNRVPYSTNGTQWNFFDAGLNLDCRLHAENGRLDLHTEVEISSVVQAEKSAPQPPSPTVAQLRLTLDSVVPPGKAVTIASIDDPASPRKFDIEVIATKQSY